MTSIRFATQIKSWYIYWWFALHTNTWYMFDTRLLFGEMTGQYWHHCKRNVKLKLFFRKRNDNNWKKKLKKKIGSLTLIYFGKNQNNYLFFFKSKLNRFCSRNNSFPKRAKIISIHKPRSDTRKSRRKSSSS